MQMGRADMLQLGCQGEYLVITVPTTKKLWYDSEVQQRDKLPATWCARRQLEGIRQALRL